MVLTVVVLLLRWMLLLLLVGKGLLQQNLLAVVMAGATGAGAGCIAAVAAAAVCAVRNHLRCASGVCLILQCKITKVVERPGVHYRGRHSPGSSFVLPAGFCSSSGTISSVDAASSFARSAVSPKKLQISSFFFCSICFPELALVFPNETFHVHMRTLTLLLFAEDFLCFRLGVIRKCTIFALLQRMIFSHCTCTFGFFFSPIFLGTFPTFQQTTLLLFLRDFWFAEPFRRIA